MTKATFLQAAAENMSADISSSVPYLADNEIAAPHTPVIKKQAASIKTAAAARIINGALHINSRQQCTTLRIFDISGRLLLQLNPEEYMFHQGTYIIPLAKLLRNRQLHLFVIQLTGKEYSATYHVMNGRIR